ncbi:MAG: sugar phosphate isomerase/epimerase [Limnochordaceae bacterium]|nr:sugar phosphate isomerase/epimerase [Limnochordaceae bacterium]
MLLSVMLSNLRLPPAEALQVAAELGLQGVQLSLGSGPWSPEEMDHDARQTWKERIHELGLVVTAVSSGFPSLPYDDLAQLDRTLARARQVVEVAADFGAKVWTSHIGIVPENPADPKRQTMVRVIRQVVDIAYRQGVFFAIETGPEPPSVLRSFIEQVAHPGLRVNYDPANLIIWPALLAKEHGRRYDEREAIERYTPTEGVEALAPYIAHVHAKDAYVKSGGEYQECLLGEGWVRWPRFLELLRHCGFGGYMAIEREYETDRVAAVRQAVDFLRRLG